MFLSFDSVRMRKVLRTTFSVICTALLTVGANSVLRAEEVPPKPEVKAKVESKDGLETVAFDTINGTVEVNLPDDMAASDTISGSVVTEPKEEKKEEVASNQDELNGYVVEIVKTKEVKEPVAKQGEAPGAPVIANDCPHVKPKKDTPSGFTCGIAPTAATVIIALISPTGEQVCQQEVPCKAKPPAKPTVCVLPPQGTCEKPLQIKGPCDGRSANSSIKINGKTCPVLAESPRQQICKPPKGCVGTGQIERSEAGKITRGTITMRPAPGVTKIASATPAGVSKAHQSAGKIWKRTGPFIEKKKYDERDNDTVEVSGNQILWTRTIWKDSNHNSGRPVQNTMTFTPPPEQIAVGDSFDEVFSLSGDPELSPMVACHGDTGRIRAEPLTATSVIVSLKNPNGTMTPSAKYHFKVCDLEADIAQYLKEHPEDKDKVAASLTSPCKFQIWSPGTMSSSIKIEWVYVPQN